MVSPTRSILTIARLAEPSAARAASISLSCGGGIVADLHRTGSPAYVDNPGREGRAAGRRGANPGGAPEAPHVTGATDDGSGIAATGGGR